MDKTNLANKITEVETFIAGVEDEIKYNNIEELKVALASAKTVNENNSATQEEVNSAAETFLSGIDNAIQI